MVAITGDTPVKSRLPEYWRIATWMFLALGCAYLFSLRLAFSSRLPLWLDESWTAVLSSAPTLHSFVDQMWLDSNAPLYYFIVWLWPFESDFGLRLPSLLFGIGAAAAAVAFAPLKANQRLFWAALLILWPPGTSLFGDARYYSLLFFLSTVQTIGFLNMVEGPDRRKACIWVSLSTLAILTHYYAAIISLFEGLCFLFLCRKKALAAWPALVFTLPAFAWLAFHWPRLRLYAEAGTSWYERITPIEGLKLMLFPWGGWVIGLFVLLLILALHQRGRISRAVAALGFTTTLSGLILIFAGLAAPVLSPRYLIPVVPPLLLLSAVSVRPVGYLPIGFLMFLPASGAGAWNKLLNERANFGLERVAELTPPDRSVTWWIDYPGSKIHDAAQMDQMLKDAFVRAGKPLRQAEWGTRPKDVFVVFYTGPRTIAPPPWPCTQLESWSQSVMVCTKPISG